ncbi:MAG: cytochrome c [Acetobacter okinawensis]|uniref:c-type cytochrome n=1 Tax=Acetobacter okinawensis TaxID=1076594 RepID=UPI0039ED780C
MRKFLLFSALMAVVVPAGFARADSASAISGKIEALPSGEAIYRHICQSCHMPDGQGAIGAGAQIPALAHNPHLQAASYPATVILNGYGAMPWFSGLLNDKQVADVVNYIRTHFGNHYTDKLNPSEVALMRPHLTAEEQ